VECRGHRFSDRPRVRADHGADLPTRRLICPT
jgi:hypothetical protein